MKTLKVPLLILFAGFLAIGLGSCVKKTSVKSPSVAKIDYFEGEVVINGKSPELGQTLPQKFTVKTGGGSFCGIIFDNKNIMHVDENTEAVIDLGRIQKTVELRTGSLGAALKNLPKQISRDSNSFLLTTPAAVAGIRGTVFYVQVEDGSNSYVCDCNGVVHLHDGKNGNERTVEATHHKAFRYTKKDGSVTSSDAEMLYHTDQMMELGASRIGETIDWTKIER